MSDIRFDLRADGSAVLAELRRVRAGVDNLTGGVRSAGEITADAFGKIGPALSVAAVTQFVDAITQAADDLADVAANVNSSVVALQGLRLAAGDASASAGALDSALGALQKNIGQAASGTGEAAKSFALLGLEADELAKLTTDEALFRVSDALAELDTTAERAGVAQRLFGDGARELVPLLEDGGEALRRQVDAYAATGYVLNAETVVALEAANRQMELLTQRVRVAASEFAVGFVPIVTSAASALVAMNSAADDAGRTSERLGATLSGMFYVLNLGFNTASATIYSTAAAVANLLSLTVLGDTRKTLQELAAEFDRFGREALEAIGTPGDYADRIAEGVVAGIARVELASENFGAFGEEFRGELSADTVAFIESLGAQTEAALAPMRAAQAEAEKIAKYLEATQGRQFGQGVNERGLVSMDDPFNPLVNTTDPTGENAGLNADIQARMEADITAAAQEQLELRLEQVSQFNELYAALTGERIENEISLEQAKAASIGQIGGMLLSSFAATNEKVAKIAQAIALAQAIWNTATGVTKALAAYDYVGAAAIAALGAVQIAKIKSTKYSGSVVSGGQSYAAGTAGGAGAEAQDRVAENAQQQRTVEVFVKGALTDGAGRVIADLVRKEVKDRNVVIIDSDSRQARELGLASG